MTTTTAGATATTEGVAKSTDATLAQLESRFAEASAQPLADQPLDELLTGYQALGNSPGLDEQTRSLIDARIAVIKDRQRIVSSQAKAVTQSYDAVGKLMASTIYTGGNMPLLYRLVDPLNGLTIAYVEASGKLGVASDLGKVVGIVGRSRYDAGLKLKIITATQIDVLRAAR
jgi:hypothetical protein